MKNLIYQMVLFSNKITSEAKKNFDGFLVLAHFKGHGMGGFGGALKQLLLIIIKTK